MTNDEQERCKSCGGRFRGEGLCCCAEGAKIDRGAEIRDKGAIGECFQPRCDQRADVDGWCDEHSEQFKKYGAHHMVGSVGPREPVPLVSGGPCLLRWRITAPDGRVLHVYAPSREAAEEVVTLVRGVPGGVTIEQVADDEKIGPSVFGTEKKDAIR